VNSFERVATALQGGVPDCVPVGPFLSNHAAHLFQVPLSKYYTNGKLMGETLYKAWELYGYDIIFAQSDGYYIAEGMGTVTECLGDNLPVIKKHAISSLAEGRNLSVPDPYKDGRMPVYLEAIDYLRSKVGSEVMIRGTGTGMFSLVSHLYGIEPLLMDMAEIQFADEDDDARELLGAFEDLMDLCTETLVRFTTAELNAGARLIHLGDSLGSLDVISPHIFRTYVWPYLRKYFDIMKPIFEKYGAFGLLHCCGNNTAVLEEYATSGANVYEVDYKVDLKQCKEQIGSKICLMGNVNPIMLWQGDVATAYCLCREAVEIGAPGGGFILGTGCETAVQTPVENLKAMVEVAHSYNY